MNLITNLKLKILVSVLIVAWESPVEAKLEANPASKSEIGNEINSSKSLIDDSDIKVHYGNIFKKTRQVLQQTSGNKKQKVLRNISESDVVDYLQSNPDKMHDDETELLKAIKKESKVQRDPTKHLRLLPPKGQFGYSDLKVYVSHPYYHGSKVIDASNLIDVWNSFLKQAQKKIMLNVFDFDLQTIADTLAEKANSGVSVTVGIDKDVINDREQVSAVYKFLKKNKVKVVAVDSVTLNHQKMAVLDWDSPAYAKVLFSSGNLTQSCLDPGGDLSRLNLSIQPEKSVPNANHMITMNSWILANLIYNELTKTLGDGFNYRGALYPVLGSYQVTGPSVNPETLEAYPEDSLIISFSPGGGFKNINKNLIAHFIKSSNGPIRMIQFAFSSSDVTEALLEKAQYTKGQFDFLSVGDTSFSLRNWSQFLKISGLKGIKNSSKQTEYSDLEEVPFRDVMGKKAYESFRSKLRIAPPNYSSSRIRINGKSYDVSAKIHHKVLSAGDFAILGTSFNFSKNAQKNNEQILVFKSKEMAKVVDGMTRWLAEKSESSVYEEAMKRNKNLKKSKKYLVKSEVLSSEKIGNLSNKSENDIEERAASP